MIHRPNREQVPSEKEPKLIVGLQVYNEEQRLPTWLDAVEEYADALVVLDDDSTDDTRALVAASPIIRILEKAPVNMFRTNEIWLRKRLWSLLKSVASVWHQLGHPVWCLLLDADEIMEDKFVRDVQALMRNRQNNWYGLKFVHFWRNRTHYRTDKLWAPSHGPRMIRYVPAFREQWQETPLHCGSLPKNVNTQNGMNLDYIIKHYGYADSKAPEVKFQRYTKLDPTGKWCPMSHYNSMLDKSPVLVPWEER